MFTADVTAEVPPAGPLTLAGIELPTGRRLRSDFGDGEPVGWVTVEPLPEDRLTELIRRLAGSFAETGLWPVAVEGLSGEYARPWLEDEFGEVDDRVLAADAVLTEAAADLMPDAGEDWEPSARYLGLADSVPGPDLTADELEPILLNEQAGGLLLVPAQRPGDVLKRLGWSGAANYDRDGEPLSAVLRSWEDRFGAVLTGLGFDTLAVQVPRRPSSDEQLRRLVGEHYVWCPDIIDQGLPPADYLAQLRTADGWAFWWD
ncbi:hypothetical protein CGZ98_12645 [Enemella evansiae]|uniref:DUF4253 domain-containing protein n=1 Tax=Enemella evansiae TaxID=2016499 RepID=UPI000B962702|nr:DUF4253 domain-containing protein [Enemella evansiae]OYO09953.1 hypothetical protein CGZ98_12645 [Enemella evansiae]